MIYLSVILTVCSFSQELRMAVAPSPSAAAGFGQGDVPSEVPRADFPVPNGLVRAMVETDGTLYLAGSFSAVGEQTGAFALLDESTADVIPRAAIDGDVKAIVSDGDGGWFVGGDFRRVGSTLHRGIVHFSSDGTIEPWDPDIDGEITAMLLDEGTLYLAGRFGEVGGVERIFLAAVDPVTADLLSWNPGDGARLSSSERIEVLFLDGPQILIGGFFDSDIGGLPRKHFAAVDPVLGLATPFDLAPNGTVNALALDGSELIVGGNFSSILGVPRNRLARIDASRTQVDPTFPEPNSTVYATELSGTTLYVGGFFTSVAGELRSRVAAIDTSTGTLLEWAPSVDGDFGAGVEVRAIVATPDAVFIAGSLANVDTESRALVAAIDPTSGTLLGWDASMAPESGGFADALARDESGVALGGRFYGAISGDIQHFRRRPLDTARTTPCAPTRSPQCSRSDARPRPARAKGLASHSSSRSHLDVYAASESGVASHTAHAKARFTASRSFLAAFRADSRPSGTPCPLPKYISSGV